MDLARELKKLWNMKLTVVPVLIGVLGTISKGLVRGLEELETGGLIETIQKYSIVEISLNIEKNPSGLRKLAVTQTPARNHQQTLV